MDTLRKRLDNRLRVIFVTNLGYARIADIDVYHARYREMTTARLHAGCTVKIMPEEGDGTAHPLILGGDARVTAAPDEDRIPEDLAKVLGADLCLTEAEYEHQCARLDLLAADLKAKEDARKARRQKRGEGHHDFDPFGL